MNYQNTISRKISKIIIDTIKTTDEFNKFMNNKQDVDAYCSFSNQIEDEISSYMTKSNLSDISNTAMELAIRNTVNKWIAKQLNSKLINKG